MSNFARKVAVKQWKKLEDRHCNTGTCKRLNCLCNCGKCSKVRCELNGHEFREKEAKNYVYKVCMNCDKRIYN